MFIDYHFKYVQDIPDLKEFLYGKGLRKIQKVLSTLNLRQVNSFLPVYYEFTGKHDIANFLHGERIYKKTENKFDTRAKLC
jgi:DUF438 domain-containing protein